MRKFILVFLLVFISGCAVKPYKIPLSNSISTDKIRVYSLISQDEIGAHVPIQNSSAATAQYGLIGALVGGAMDSSVNSRNTEIAEKNLAPIRDSLIDFDFRSKFHEALNEMLREIDVLNFYDVETVFSLEDVETKHKDDEPFLLISTNYLLGMNFETLNVSSSFQIASSAIPQEYEEILYRNRFTFSAPLTLKPEKSEGEIEAGVKEVNDWYSSLSNEMKHARNVRSAYFKRLKAAQRKDYTREEIIEKNSESWVNEFNSSLREYMHSSGYYISKLFIDEVEGEFSSTAVIGSEVPNASVRASESGSF